MENYNSVMTTFIAVEKSQNLSNLNKQYRPTKTCSGYISGKFSILFCNKKSLSGSEISGFRLSPTFYILYEISLLIL